MTHLFPTEEAFVTVFTSAVEKVAQNITDFCDDFQAKMQAFEDDVTTFDCWYDDVLCNEFTFDPEDYGIELTEEPADENQPA